jgi:hypothetical protein
MKLTSSRNTPRPLTFASLPTGCFINTSHKVNPDGYFRYNLGGRINGKPLMFHRIMWELKKSPIPDGYEINHLCNNRGCCNVDHLECIEKSEHKVLTNTQRWKLPSGRVAKIL